jgi:hypothetical protein
MAESGEIGPTTLFWSEWKAEWLPLKGLMFDIDEPSDRLADFIDSGISHVQILGSGHDTECAACAGLAERFFRAEVAPTLPPEECTCIPWCRCIYIAVCEEDIPNL